MTLRKLLSCKLGWPSGLKVPRSREARLMLIGTLAGCLIFVAWWYGGTCWTPERIGAAINHALPRGSSRAQVEAWLNSNRIYALRQTESTSDMRQAGSWIEMDDVGGGRAIRASLWEKRNCILLRLFGEVGQIQVWFFFNTDGKLVSHSVEVVRQG